MLRQKDCRGTAEVNDVFKILPRQLYCRRLYSWNSNAAQLRFKHTEVRFFNLIKFSPKNIACRINWLKDFIKPYPIFNHFTQFFPPLSAEGNRIRLSPSNAKILLNINPHFPEKPKSQLPPFIDHDLKWVQTITNAGKYPTVVRSKIVQRTTLTYVRPANDFRPEWLLQDQ